jgi:hypothetical protein
MASAPQIALRDGSGFTTALVFTTNQDNIVLTGTIGIDTAAVQVSINGGAFSSDPTLIKIDLNTFTVPNLTIFPSGYLLDPGVNTIVLRAIDIVGGVSATSTATITRVEAVSVTGAEIPSGVRVRRLRDNVNLLAALPDPPSASTVTAVFRGFNFYASTTPGGATGYFRINEALVTEASSTYEENVYETFDEIALWSDSKLKYTRIRVTEEDEFGNELTERFNGLRLTNNFSQKVRYTSLLESYNRFQFARFQHNRNGGPGQINADQFSDVAATDPLYYVVTALYYDPATGIEIETPYSQEVLGTPLVLDTAIRDLPGRTMTQIVTDYITLVTRVNTEISLIPGSTTRDVSIDPFASETERVWFLFDFVHRSQSFLTLLQIDDANGDGTSDPVASSAYKSALKSALGYTSNQGVQNLVDTQFDKLAGNVQKARLAGRFAVGQAVVFTTAKPTIDIIVPAGSTVGADTDTENNLPSIRFRVGGSYTLPAASADAYYNFNTKRYELIIDIIAETIGTTGNRPAGSITSISGVDGVDVTNTEATVFGEDSESNAELAARSIIAFTSVDTGTEGGYYSTTAEQIGIVKAKVVKSGDPLMMRDWDEVRKKHIGGKVDVWVQGLRERQVTEPFAFSFEEARDIQCQIIDLTNLIFRVLDSRVTPTTPIIEILNNPPQGLGVRNATMGTDYDLTGVLVLDYQTFKINTALPQPVTAIDDVIIADYRFRSINKFIFTFQPVRRIVSVVGEISGALAVDTNYSLYKTDDPLLIGESTISEDYLSVIQAAGKPSGTQIPINDEAHVLIGFVNEPLDSIGINTKTIRVFSADRVTEYSGPEAAAPDFDIIEGTDRTPTKIVRTATSIILNGQSVSVDYVKDENFTVTYVINDLLQQLQAVINIRRHVTADVLVKQTIENPLDIETTVQLKKGATKDNVDPSLRTNVSVELNKRLIGQGIAQSDVINTIDSTTGVDYEVVPLAKMAYSDGSRRLREPVRSLYVHLTTLDIGGQRVFILTNALETPTTDSGGLVTEHKGVFQDDVMMTPSSTLNTVGSAVNQAYIIGSSGAIITGYSDDATLTAAGFTTAAAREAERLRRTANHVVVSLSGAGLPLDVPTNHVFACSYVVRGDSGAHDIAAADVEFVDLGALVVTYHSGV